MTMEGIQAATTRPRCPVCATEINNEQPPQETHRCQRCETLHHKDCWDYTGGCAIFGCNSLPTCSNDEVAARIAAVPELTMQLRRYLGFRRNTMFLQYIASLMLSVSIFLLVISFLIGPNMLNVYVSLALTLVIVAVTLLGFLAYFASVVLQIVERFVRPKGADKLIAPDVEDTQVIAQANRLQFGWLSRPIPSYLSFTTVPIVLKLTLVISFVAAFIVDKTIGQFALFDSLLSISGVSLFTYVMWLSGWTAARETVLVKTLGNRLDNRLSSFRDKELDHCPVCHGEVNEEKVETSVVCPVCKQRHHKECYAFAKGCGKLSCRDSSYALAIPDVPPSLLFLKSALKYQTGLMGVISATAFFGLIGLSMRMADALLAKLVSAHTYSFFGTTFIDQLGQLTFYPVIVAVMLTLILILLCIPTILARLFIDYRLGLTLKNTNARPRPLLDNLSSGPVSQWFAMQLEKVQPYAAKSLYLVPIFLLQHFIIIFVLNYQLYFSFGPIALMLLLTAGPILAINSRIAYLVALENRITASFKK